MCTFCPLENVLLGSLVTLRLLSLFLPGESAAQNGLHRLGWEMIEFKLFPFITLPMYSFYKVELWEPSKAEGNKLCLPSV